MANQVILDAEVFPDYHCVYIEDLDTGDVADPSGNPCSTTDHSITVATMTADDAIDDDVDVKVTIYSGSDATQLGERIYDGVLKLDTGELAIGNVADTGVRANKVTMGAGEIHLQVFVDTPFNARVVNVLIEPN